MVGHEELMIFGGYSSLRGRVITPACSPDPGTSFLRFLEILKILIFLNGKFYLRIFHFVLKFSFWATDITIIGKPIEIDAKAVNCKYLIEKSKSQKSRGGILIIYFLILFFMFILSKIMFLGQGSKYNGKFRVADSKILPKPWFFHQKSSKTIDFSWFSLSELPYSKSQQPTCLLQVQSS